MRIHMRQTNRTNRTTRVVVVLACGGLLAGMALAQGCYRRVVGARGLGASNYEIEKPYQENSKVDDWIFGERPGQDARHRRVE